MVYGVSFAKRSTGVIAVCDYLTCRQTPQSCKIQDAETATDPSQIKAQALTTLISRGKLGRRLPA